MKKIILLCCILMCTSCGVIGEHASFEHPSSLGLSVNLETIFADIDNYQAYYSSASYNPSALLFVPKNSPYKVIPETKGIKMGWHPVADLKEIKKMQKVILDRDRLSNPVVWALMSPDLPETGKRVVLGYIYTIKSTYARSVPGEKNTFMVLSIPEILGKYTEKRLK